LATVALWPSFIRYRKIADMTVGLGRGVYAGFSVEAGEVWSYLHSFNASDITTAGSLFLGTDTFLGAVYLGAGFTDEGEGSLSADGPHLRPRAAVMRRLEKRTSALT
jgi:hypothetical protein